MAMKFMIVVDPDNVALTHESVRWAHTLSDRERQIAHLQQRFPGAVLHIYQLIEMQMVEVPAVMRRYLVNENGEVLPQ